MPAVRRGARRSVETNGDHKPKRFSTWTPKAIAAIGELADTLRDRAVILQLHRKPKAAKVARLRKRDSDEFALLRRKAARWAADNFDNLRDPDPEIPDALDDRAADNWRPLLAIADLAGDDWPRRAREAACLLSGEGHDAASIEIDLLADLRNAFGDEPAVASIDLIARLAADPERPWAEWKDRKPITANQLRDLLKPFGVFPEKIRLPGRKDFRGYRRIWLEELWEAYLPSHSLVTSKNPSQGVPSVPCAENTGTSYDFLGVAEGSRGTPPKPSSYPTAMGKRDTRDTSIPCSGCGDEFDQAEAGLSDDPEPMTDPASDTGLDDAETAPTEFGSIPNSTRAQVEPRATKLRRNAADDLDIPPFLDRRPKPRQDGPWAGTGLSDDDIEFLESGKFK